MKKNIIDKWREEVTSVSRTIILCILNNYAYTERVRIIIIQEPLKEEKVLQTIVNTYDDKKQDFRFYIRDSQDETEICIYEDNMSRKNKGNKMTIVENNKISLLDEKKIKSYSNSIVEFFLANIEWK